MDLAFFGCPVWIGSVSRPLARLAGSHGSPFKVSVMKVSLLLTLLLASLSARAEPLIPGPGSCRHPGGDEVYAASRQPGMRCARPCWPAGRPSPASSAWKMAACAQADPDPFRRRHPPVPPQARRGAQRPHVHHAGGRHPGRAPDLPDPTLRQGFDAGTPAHALPGSGEHRRPGRLMPADLSSRRLFRDLAAPEGGKPASGWTRTCASIRSTCSRIIAPSRRIKA